MVRYLLSCGHCEFSANVSDLSGLGSQLNAHESSCNGAPLLAVQVQRDQADSAIEVAGEAQISLDREAEQLPACVSCEKGAAMDFVSWRRLALDRKWDKQFDPSLQSRTVDALIKMGRLEQEE